jgi:hypothetical protein
MRSPAPDVRVERVVGVDFSAAKADAGRRTWVAEAAVGDGELELTALSDAAGHLGCAPSREATLAALVEYLTAAREERVVVGLDFPFSLPAALLAGDDWHAFVAATPGRWGRLDGVDSPRALYEAATRLAAAENASLRRATDAARGGQEPTGFRIKTQTYYGVSAVLRRVAGDVAVAPFDDAAAADTVLVEAYPAALFDSLSGATRTGYKRDTREGVEARRRNAAALEAAGVGFGGDEAFAVATDDALDAVAAAVAAWRAAADDFAVDGDGAGAEGHIYA